MSEPRIITLDELVAIDDLPEEVVEIPEWDGQAVRIRGMTYGQQLDVRRESKGPDGEFDVDLWETALLSRCVVEPAVEPAVIRGKSAAAVQRILIRVLRLSGMGKEVVQEAKKTFSARPGDAVRVSPGDGSQDDREGAAPADEWPGDGPVGGLVLGGGGAGEAGSAES